MPVLAPPTPTPPAPTPPAPPPAPTPPALPPPALPPAPPPALPPAPFFASPPAPTPPAPRRTIAHLDLDAFFASVEVRDAPHLADRPVVVGYDTPRGVVAAANYPARRFGVHSAMPIARAKRLCRHLVILPPRFDAYQATSARFFEILHRYSPFVEGLSLDEAYLDLSATPSPVAAITQLRAEVWDTLQLRVSAGIAPVKFAAKIASDLAKPNGQLELTPETLLPTLHPLPVSRLWGVGKVRALELAKAGIHKIGDLARADLAALSVRIGDRSSYELNQLALGHDSRTVTPDRETRSISAEETFERDLLDPTALDQALRTHAAHVAARLQRHGVVTTGVALKYRLPDFTVVTRQTTLPPTADATALYAAGRALMAAHPPPGPIRLLGLSACKLIAPPAPDLLDLPQAPSSAVLQARPDVPIRIIRSAQLALSLAPPKRP